MQAGTSACLNAKRLVFVPVGVGAQLKTGGVVLNKQSGMGCAWGAKCGGPGLHTIKNRWHVFKQVHVKKQHPTTGRIKNSWGPRV